MTKLQAPRKYKSFLPSCLLPPASCLLILAILLSNLTTACAPSPANSQASIEQRTFLDLSLDFLGEYQLPKMQFQDTTVGGLSGLTYDRQRNLFYAISDDRSESAPARFYTLNLKLNTGDTGEIALEKVEVADVTFLKDENGATFAQGTIDPEGIALSAKKTVYISSEGATRQGIAPFIREFDLTTGQQQKNLPIPQRYLPNESSDSQPEPRGIQNNLGFESLSLEPISLAAGKGDPFRLFTATESALFQDSLADTPQEPTRIRLLHYLIQEFAPTIVVSEHLYLLEPPPLGTIGSGLTDIITLDGGGHFLSLERTYGTFGVMAKIYQLALGGATDTSKIASLKGDIANITPVKKKLLLDLSTLGMYLDNLEGITLGPRLPDGTQSLLLVSDDNFSDVQVTQFLLFRLNIKEK
ncbi:MAG: esterase-like activity of phytase family protein [Symploca sp. SIO2D2]|nr:esterase-like activity of phytase family protein [Symploca sp. SIO2D2]